MSNKKNDVPTVRQLRKAGYKVKVNHFRYIVTHAGEMLYPMLWFREPRSLVDKMKTKGGRTEVTIRGQNGEEFFGYSDCSKEDNYNRKLGVRIALGRALKGLEL